MPNIEHGADGDFVWTEGDMLLVFKVDPDDGPEAEADLIDKCLGDLERAKQVAAEDAGVPLTWQVVPTRVFLGGTRCRGASAATSVYYDIFLG